MSRLADYTLFDGYGLRHLTAHLSRAGQSQHLCHIVLDADWLVAKSQYDPSQWGYVRDLDIAFDIATQQGSQGWPHLAANSLMRASLTSIANYLPVEAYEALVRLDRGREALQRTRVIAKPERKRDSLRRIKALAEKLEKANLAKEAEEEMTGLPMTEADRQSKDDDWLIDVVDQMGTERALQATLRGQVAPDPDRSKAAESYLEVAEAAIALDQHEEARKLLLDCLDLLGETWEHDRQRLITRIASLLFKMGYEADLGHLIDLAQNIELEHYRVLTVSDLALICSNASDSALAKHALEAAVEEIRSAERRSTLQFEMSKVALAMSRLGDPRADKWLGKAIDLAGRPTQPAWHWEEKEAWGRVAGGLASVGLCDEALELARHIGPKELDERIVVELALQDRWDDAWQLAQDMRQTVRKHGLVAVARTLAQRNKLKQEQARTIVTEIEKDLSSDRRPHDQIKTLEQLIDIALVLEDRSRAQAYLSQIADAIGEVSVRKKAEVIGDASRCAVRLDDLEMVHRLMRLAQDLPTDKRYLSHSNAIANVAKALADIGEIEDAWSLSQDIDEDWKRLETYVRICELAEQQGQATKELLARTLAFARGVDNVGFVPTYWGKLAVLSQRLGRQDDMEECINWAIEGIYATESSQNIGPSSIISSAYVAQSLYELGLSDKAEKVLKYGISQDQPVLQNIQALRRLTQTVVKIRADLWPDVVRAAQGFEEPAQRAQALLEITRGIVYSGSTDYAVEILPPVLDAIQDAGRNLYSLLKFGALLEAVFETESQFLDDLIVDIFQDVHLLDRPRTLTAIAALLPVFAKVDSTLPRATWNEIEHVEDLLNQWRS
jgi:tetratricopeptide (TPR) repeat protein